MSNGGVPLATPLLAGPGAIVTTILFARQADAARDITAIGAGIAAVHIVLWLVLRFTGVPRRLIRETGVLLVSRVTGVLLAAIAVEFIADGVIGFVAAASPRPDTSLRQIRDYRRPKVVDPTPDAGTFGPMPEANCE